MTKVSIKKNINTISLPEENFSILDSITDDGYFVYKVRYLIDPVKALKNNTLLVNINVTKNPFISEKQKVFNNFNSTSLIRSILLLAPTQKDLSKSQKNNFIVSYKSDITKKIPNNKITSLTRTIFTNKPFLSETNKIKAALISDLQKENLKLPTLEKNRNTLGESDITYSNNLLKSISNSMLLNKKDPAQIIGNKTNNILSAHNGISGIIPNKLSITQLSNQENKVLIGSIINRTNVTNQSQLNSNEYINVTTKEQSQFIEIEESIKIPISEIQNENFYFVLQLQNRNNTTEQTLSVNINHNKNISELELPTQPPTVRLFEKIGLNVFDIKQEDKNAIGVKIYRKETNKSKPNISSTYDFVGSILLSCKDGFQKIEDIYPSTNPVVYRIIPFNSSEMLSAEFTSVVAKQNLNKKYNLFQTQHFVSILYEIKENNIEIVLKNLPTGPIAVKLLRKNLTNFQKNYEQIGNITIVDSDTNVPIMFEDINVKIGYIYEYVIQFIYKNGLTVLSSNSIMVEYNPITNNILQLNTTNPNIINTDDGIDIQFTIQKNIIDTENDLIKKFLSEQGLIPEFQEQIINDREKLQDLFAIRVLRSNITTGEIEDFGIIQTNQFSDKNLGRVKSIKPLQSGYDYSYEFIAYAREPETLFPNLERNVATSINTSYNLKPQKYKHPVTLSRGNIVTASTLHKNYSKTTFTFGYIADRRIVNVSLIDVLPSLYDGKAKIIKSNAVMLQWKIQGNVNKIDHFVIVLDINGSRTVVGKCHNITENNAFVFVDELTNKESGALTYFIIPVFFDFSRGTEFKTNQVIV